MVMARKFIRWDKIALLLFILCAVLVLSTAVLAVALPSNFFVGMSGVSNSNLSIGMSGVTGQYFIGMNVPAVYVNPQATGGFLNLYAFVFITLGVLSLLLIGFTEGFTPKGLILMAVAIYITIALLMGIHDQVGSIIGGY